MAGLVLDEQWDSQVIVIVIDMTKHIVTQVAEYGAINMTGLRIVQYNSQLAKDVFPRCHQKSSNNKLKKGAQGTWVGFAPFMIIVAFLFFALELQ